MRTFSIDLEDDEVAALKKFRPMLETFRHLIPAGLLSVVRKLEEGIKDV